ncbi:MAG: alpha/beta hydrolase family protein [Candidatus Brocadiaceae bacterium]
MNKYLMQALDRLYCIFNNPKIRASQKHDIGDFSHLVRKEYLENPELFYKKPDKVPDFSLHRVTMLDGIEVVDVHFPSPIQTAHAENNTAHGIFFKAHRALASIILLHGWGRNNLWKEREIATTIAKNNINCFILKLPFHMERTPTGAWSGEYSITGDILRTVEGTRQLVIEVMMVASWLRKYAEKVVISGISLGGMMAHLAMAVEPFDAGITILAGGNNAGIIWDGIATKRVRDNIIKAGFAREETSHIYQIINPTVLARHNKTKNLFMINGLYDEIMPRRYTIELWEALGRPKIKWYPCAHMSVVFFLKKVVKDMIQFVHEELKK